MGRTVIVRLAAGSLLAVVGLLIAARARARSRRRYVRRRLVPYRTDRAGPEAAVAKFEAVHAAVVQR